MRLPLEWYATTPIHHQQSNLGLVACHTDLNRLWLSSTIRVGLKLFANCTQTVLQKLGDDVEKILWDQRKRARTLVAVERDLYSGDRPQVFACYSCHLLGRTRTYLAGVAIEIHNSIRSSRQRQELGGERLHADAGKKQAVQEVVNERPRVVIRLAFPPLQIAPLLHAKGESKRMVLVSLFEPPDDAGKFIWPRGPHFGEGLRKVIPHAADFWCLLQVWKHVEVCDAVGQPDWKLLLQR
mmetsp:Transcript_52990/g.124396  ORF Transcript_52990/g.124396 Transcript_52990/m.124396 type:complete len:239 (-) Transcript_52990:334-1050(-)